MTMPVVRILITAAVIGVLCPRASAVAQPSADAEVAAAKWTRAHFTSTTAALPFSFTYGGKASAGLLRQWKFQKQSSSLDEYREQETFTYSDPSTHLEVRCVMVRYKDYPSVEWTLYFKNSGTSPTPILENIQALDASIEGDTNGQFRLHYSKGSSAKPD